LPKDHENIPLPNWTTEDLREKSAIPFAADQMIRCDVCLRANPPTRVDCLYCSEPLAHDEKSVDLQKPSLRPLEKWERGYNNILLPPIANLPEGKLTDAAELLRVSQADLARILSAATPLPLARTATREEAELLERRLEKLDIPTTLMVESDQDARQIRALEFGDRSFRVFQQLGVVTEEIEWVDVQLLVSGRLLTKRVEIHEQRKRVENNIVDSSQFMTDELVMDFYTSNQPAFRVLANNFDFTCLGTQKALIAAENLVRLFELFRTKAPQAECDDSFNSQRKLLDLIWPPEQVTRSSGLRRERPGKFSLGSATEVTNHEQFSRYSELLRFLQTRRQQTEASA
jgi:hypothetical protein